MRQSNPSFPLFNSFKAHDRISHTRQVWCFASKKDHHLPQNLFSNFSDLPRSNHTLTSTDETCDTYTEVCKTPLHTFESRCDACGGAGSISTPSSRKGHNRHHTRKISCTCLICSGVGYVRHISQHFDPSSLGKEYYNDVNRPNEGQSSKRTKISFHSNWTS